MYDRVKWLTKITITEKESDNYYHYFDNRILPPQVDKEMADKDGWWYKPEYLFNELNINRSLFPLSFSLLRSLSLSRGVRTLARERQRGKERERERKREREREGDAPSRTNPRYL
jgi:hypothetical protein